VSCALINISSSSSSVLIFEHCRQAHSITHHFGKRELADLSPHLNNSCQGQTIHGPSRFSRHRSTATIHCHCYSIAEAPYNLLCFTLHACQVQSNNKSSLTCAQNHWMLCSAYPRGQRFTGNHIYMGESWAPPPCRSGLRCWHCVFRAWCPIRFFCFFMRFWPEAAFILHPPQKKEKSLNEAGDPLWMKQGAHSISPASSKGNNL
jgi:hypothetical protein